jgi:hypothetical protein
VPLGTGTTPGGKSNADSTENVPSTIDEPTGPPGGVVAMYSAVPAKNQATSEAYGAEGCGCAAVKAGDDHTTVGGTVGGAELNEEASTPGRRSILKKSPALKVFVPGSLMSGALSGSYRFVITCDGDGSSPVSLAFQDNHRRERAQRRNHRPSLHSWYHLANASCHAIC